MSIVALHSVPQHVVKVKLYDCIATHLLLKERRRICLRVPGVQMEIPVQTQVVLRTEIKSPRKGDLLRSGGD